jgi:hypothetical protein
MKISLLGFLFLSFSFFAKAHQQDSVVIKRLFDLSLTNGESYENLRVLCKTIGHRLSGSPQAAKAVVWGKKVMENAGFDKVYLQEVMVPHWVRGTKEAAALTLMNNPKTKDGMPVTQKMKISVLGGSVGTNGITTGEVIEVKDLAELDQLGEANIKGKIVFYNRPFDPTYIQTFKAYGHCVDQRVDGASKAAKYGAKGVIIRSMAHGHGDHPHTGSVRYTDSLPKIPAAAISTVSADLIADELAKGRKVFFSMEFDCQLLPDVLSYNVIGEMKGSVYPDQVISVGGHLDSWDIGEGAHDDGAGCVQSMEALRMLKVLGVKPRHTLRAVLFMNEENGLRGGKKYAELASASGEKHVAALESDRGGFVPRGFSIEGSAAQVKWLESLSPLLKSYDLHYFEEGGTGADISPLKKYFPDIVLFGFVPDSQRYFDHHHAETDVFENVNKRELELGAASMAALVYLIDYHLLK